MAQIVRNRHEIEVVHGEDTLGNPTVVVIRGLPLSGKTTLGKALSGKLGLLFIDIDDMRHVGVGETGRREGLNPWQHEASARRETEDMQIAYTLLHEAVRQNIRFGRSVIIAATYSRQSSQRFLSDIVAAHPDARLKAVRCVFNDTAEEIMRRLAGDRGMSNCLTVEHYLTDKNVRHDYTDLWGVLEVNTSESLEISMSKIVQFLSPGWRP